MQSTSGLADDVIFTHKYSAHKEFSDHRVTVFGSLHETECGYLCEIKFGSLHETELGDCMIQSSVVYMRQSLVTA